MSKRKKFSAVMIHGTLPPLEVTLFHNRVKLRKRLAERGHKVELADDSMAQTFAVVDMGTLTHFVLLEDAEDEKLHDQLALLAHEAVHIASAYFDSIGENEPAEEERAYVVQAACSALFDMHLKWIDKE